MAEAGGFFSKMRDLEVPPPDPADPAGGHAGLIRDFVRCLRTGETPETVCTDNIKCLAMVFDAIDSADASRRVVIS